MPVCITGMHRSGTSLVAHLLHSCGLYLGKEEDLMPPTVDNPKGYWENRKFLLLNDEILRELGGNWQVPPVTANGCSDEERLTQLRAKAEILLQDFLDHEPWGWKDPRTSLTLSFWSTLDSVRLRYWLALAPKLKVVICLRNPLEVSRSLKTRTFTPNSEGLDLWLTYNQTLLDSVRSEDRIITHYESYFNDAASELRRVLNFLNLPAADNLIDQSIREVSESMRRIKFTPDSVLAASGRREVFSLYQDMCNEANYKATLENVHD